MEYLEEQIDKDKLILINKNDYKILNDKGNNKNKSSETNKLINNKTYIF